MPQLAHLGSCTGAQGKGCSCEARRYWRILLITLGICAVQIAGGIMSRSLALFSDSVHVATDGASAFISFMIARYVQARTLSHAREKKVRRFWMRASGSLLLASLLWIIWEAIERFRDPTAVTGLAVMLVAAIGAAGNVWQHRLVPHDRTETSKAQRLHVESDLYSSIAVVLSGAAIWATGFTAIDPIISLCIVLFVGRSTVRMMLRGDTPHNHGHTH